MNPKQLSVKEIDFLTFFFLPCFVPIWKKQSLSFTSQATAEVQKALLAVKGYVDKNGCSLAMTGLSMYIHAKTFIPWVLKLQGTPI